MQVFRLTLFGQKANLGSSWYRGEHPICQGNTMLSERNTYWLFLNLTCKIESAKPGTVKKRRTQTLPERWGQLQKPALIAGWSWHAESDLIRRERELARMDCTWAPPSVNYTGPSLHLNLHEKFWWWQGGNHGEGLSANPSACRTSRQMALATVQWTDRQGKGTRLASVLAQDWHECNDQRLNYQPA